MITHLQALPPAPWLSAEVREQLTALCRGPDPATLAAAALRPSLDRSVGVPRLSTRLERALHELLLVHRAEFALLLRRAAQLRMGEGRCGRDDLAACRAGLQEVLDVARADGLVWPRSLERLARRLIAGEPGDWPAALRLARTAHALAPCSASWTLQASALGGAGRRTCAARLLARALLARPPAERGRVILRELVGLLSGLRREHGMRDLALVLARARRRSTQRGAA